MAGGHTVNSAARNPATRNPAARNPAASDPTGAPVSKVLVIRNPRRTGGADRHAESWAAILRCWSPSVEIEEIWFDGRPSIRSLLTGALDLVRGRIVPEALLVDDGELRRLIDGIAPDVVVLQTARVYRPGMLGAERTVLDFVDQLSVSYRQRGRTSGPARRAAFAALAWTHRRFERYAATLGIPLVAVGGECADALGATWMPVTVRPIDQATTPFESRSHDAVFFGKLDYPPNVEALEFLARCDTEGLEILVTGRSPSERVVELCRRNQWDLEKDFDSPTDLANRARIAIAPLQSAVGIQNKVLEAAAAGMAQLVTPAALGGIGRDFPAVVVDSPESFEWSLREMLADQRRTEFLARQAHAYVAERFEPASWVETARRLCGREVGSTGPVLRPSQPAVH